MEVVLVPVSVPVPMVLDLYSSEPSMMMLVSHHPTLLFEDATARIQFHSNRLMMMVMMKVPIHSIVTILMVLIHSMAMVLIR